MATISDGAPRVELTAYDGIRRQLDHYATRYRRTWRASAISSM